jgi:NTE family protein
MRSATATIHKSTVVSAPDFLIVPELEGVQLRDWKAFDRAVEAGYSATVRALKSMPESLRQIR